MAQRKASSSRCRYSDTLFGRNFCPSRSTTDIWHSFLACWSTAYVGHPDIIRVDQESAFTSQEFEKLAHRNGIHIQLSGVQSHNAIGPGERYHQPLRRIFNRINEDVPTIDPHLALQLAIKAMNDTSGPEGLVPSLLVFGVLPRFPPLSPDLPGHKDRMTAMNSARQQNGRHHCTPESATCAEITSSPFGNVRYSTQ